MSKAVVSKSLKEQWNTPVNVSRAAHTAMDNNNSSTSSAWLIYNLPEVLINESNIKICRKYIQNPWILLHPRQKTITRNSYNSSKTLIIAPNQSMTVLLNLNRAKAAGSELDSFDSFIKLAAFHRHSVIKNKTKQNKLCQVRNPTGSLFQQWSNAIYPKE